MQTPHEEWIQALTANFDLEKPLDITEPIDTVAIVSQLATALIDYYGPMDDKVLYGHLTKLQSAASDAHFYLIDEGD